MSSPVSTPQSGPGGLGTEESISVLLVEDNPGDARLFEEYLSEGPVEADVRHEESLRACLKALGEREPDVLVADLGLPDSEGAQTIKAAAAAAPEVPIVVLTGDGNLQAALDAQQAGAAEYLQKEELTPALAGRTLRWALRQSRMQAKLRQRDAWIRSITESISAGVFRVGPTGRIEYANQALADMLGVDTEEELIGQDLTGFYADPIDRGKMLAEEGAAGMEVKLEGEGGEERIGLLSAKPAYDQNGNPLHYDGTITDITGRARRKERLRMLSEAVEQAQESILITEAAPLDEPGPRVEYVNAAYEEMTGYSREEMKGKTPRVLQGPETDRDVLDSLREALETGEEWQGETVNYRKDGEPYRVQWNVAPVINDSGEIEHWVSVQRDVTERREQEEKLRLLAEAFEQVGDKVMITGTGGQIEYVNDAFEQVTGYSRAEVLGKTPAIVHSGEQGEAFYEELWATIQSGETFRSEMVNKRKDGSQYVEEEVIAPVTDEEGEITHFVSTGRDVTERKEAEKELRSTKSFYEQILAQAPIDLAVFSPEAEFEYVNPQSVGDPEMREWLIGHTNEDYCRKRGIDLELGRRRHRSIRTSAQEKETVQFEETIETGEGPRHYLRAHSPVTDLDGEVTHVVAFGLDITEQKRRRRRLERYREYTSRILDAIDDLFLALDEEARFQRWNRRVPEVSGYSDEEIAEMGAFDLVPESERERLAEALGEGLRAGSAQIEIPLLRKDGTTVPYEFTGNLVESPEGDLRMVGIGRDITERTEAKERLRGERDLLDRLIETSPAAVVVLDGDGQFVRANERAEEVLGIGPDEVTERAFNDPDWGITTPGGDPIPDKELPFAQVIATGEPVEDFEHAIEWPDGTRRILSVSGAPLQGEEGGLEGAVFHLSDVTEQKRRERDLIEAKEEAERMNRLKSAFLANMSHEIRTPLTSILGFAEAIGEESRGASSAGELDLASLGQFAALIERSGQRLMETLTGVLNLSKLEAGEMNFDLGPTDLAKEAKEVAEEFAPQAKEAGLDLKTEGPDGPVWGRADDGGLQIALRNLISNAIKYTESGGTVRIRARRAGDMAVLEVEDTGIGMDPAEAQGLFEAFKQASEGVGREYEGTGLGLTVTKEVLDQMGGSIEVETEKGAGSRFTVRLPHTEAIETEDAG